MVSSAHYSTVITASIVQGSHFDWILFKSLSNNVLYLMSPISSVYH
jgi:hypothetical protein